LDLHVVGKKKKISANPTTSTEILEEMVDLDRTLLSFGQCA
jgi:hypothetical protein